MGDKLLLQAHIDLSTLRSDLKQAQKVASTTKINVGGKSGNKSLKETDTLLGGILKKVIHMPIAFGSWLIIGNIVTSIYRAMSDFVDKTFEFDKALTNIGFTMEVTNTELNDMLDNALQTADALSSTASNVLIANQVFSNLSESIEDLNNKTETTIMLSNLTGDTIRNTSDAVQGIIFQFDLASSESEKLGSALANIARSTGVEFSRSIQGMTQAVSRAGSTSATAGFEFQEFLATVATVQEVSRQQGGAIASGITTILSRMSRVSNASAEEISKVETSLRKVGVALRDQEGEFRDTFDVLIDLSKVYKDLSSVEQEELNFLLSGTRQRKVLIPILENMDTIVQRANASIEEQNTLMQLNDQYAESLEGRLKDVTNSWEALVASFKASGFFKFLVTGFADSIDLVTRFNEKIGIVESAIRANPAVGWMGEFIIRTRKATEQVQEFADGTISLHGDVFGVASEKSAEEISAITKLIDEYKKLEETMTDLDQARKTQIGSQESKESIKKLDKQIESVNNRYAELSDELRKNGIDTNNLDNETKRLTGTLADAVNGLRYEKLVIQEVTEAQEEAIKSDASKHESNQITIQQLDSLAKMYPHYAESVVQSEVNATKTTITQTQERLHQMGIELEALRTLTNARNASNTDIVGTYFPMQDEIATLDLAIARLKDLESVQTKYFDTSKKGSKTLKKETVDIMDSYKSLQSELKDTTDALSTLDEMISRTDDEEEKINLLQQQIDLRKEQQQEIVNVVKAMEDDQNSGKLTAEQYDKVQSAIESYRMEFQKSLTSVVQMTKAQNELRESLKPDAFEQNTEALRDNNFELEKLQALYDNIDEDSDKSGKKRIDNLEDQLDAQEAVTKEMQTTLKLYQDEIDTLDESSDRHNELEGLIQDQIISLIQQEGKYSDILELIDKIKDGVKETNKELDHGEDLQGWNLGDSPKDTPKDLQFDRILNRTEFMTQLDMFEGDLNEFGDFIEDFGFKFEGLIGGELITFSMEDLANFQKKKLELERAISDSQAEQSRLINSTSDVGENLLKMSKELVHLENNSHALNESEKKRMEVLKSEILLLKKIQSEESNRIHQITDIVSDYESELKKVEKNISKITETQEDLNKLVDEYLKNQIESYNKIKKDIDDEIEKRRRQAELEAVINKQLSEHVNTIKDAQAELDHLTEIEEKYNSLISDSKSKVDAINDIISNITNSYEPLIKIENDRLDALDKETDNLSKQRKEAELLANTEKKRLGLNEKILKLTGVSNQGVGTFEFVSSPEAVADLQEAEKNYAEFIEDEALESQKKAIKDGIKALEDKRDREIAIQEDLIRKEEQLQKQFQQRIDTERRIHNRKELQDIITNNQKKIDEESIRIENQLAIEKGYYDLANSNLSKFNEGQLNEYKAQTDKLITEAHRRAEELRKVQIQTPSTSSPYVGITDSGKEYFTGDLATRESLSNTTSRSLTSNIIPSPNIVSSMPKITPITPTSSSMTIKDTITVKLVDDSGNHRGTQVYNRILPLG